MIPASANFGGDEFLDAGSGGVYGVQLHAELLGGDRAGEAFEGNEAEGLPGLRLDAFLDGNHAVSEQVELLQTVEFFFEFSDLIFGLAVFFSELRAGEVFFVGIGFAKAAPRNGSQPRSETAAAGMFEALNLGKYDQQGVVCEVFGIGNLQPFPACPVSEDTGGAGGKFCPRLIVAGLDTTKHPEGCIQLRGVQCRPLTKGTKIECKAKMPELIKT
jgi:hypothetical protein